MSQTRPTHGGNRVWAASLAQCSPGDILDFSASINPLGPPPGAIAAIQAHLSQITSYPDPSYRELRTLLAAQHNLEAEWILPGNGAAELLTWAGRDLAACSKTYLFAPGFRDYQRAIQTFGGEIQPVVLPIADSIPQPFNLSQGSQTLSSGQFPRAWHLAWETLAKPPGFLLNNPHNPTGMLFLTEPLEDLLKRGCLVVVDEAFMDFLPPESQTSVISWVPYFTNLVVLRSLTKFYSLPGLRLGYAIAHPDRLRRWHQWRDPWPVNTLAMVAGEAVLGDRAFAERTWAWLPSARHQLATGIAKIPGLMPLPSATNFLLVQSQVPVLELQLVLLRQSRILIRDCLSFAELGDRFFRVAIRTEAENQHLLQALETSVAQITQTQH